MWAVFILHARSSFDEVQPIRLLIAGGGNAELIPAKFAKFCVFICRGGVLIPMISVYDIS
jgi:hypothetical protein